MEIDFGLANLRVGTSTDHSEIPSGSCGLNSLEILDQSHIVSHWGERAFVGRVFFSAVRFFLPHLLINWNPSLGRSSFVIHCCPDPLPNLFLSPNNHADSTQLRFLGPTAISRNRNGMHRNHGIESFGSSLFGQRQI